MYRMHLSAWMTMLCLGTLLKTVKRPKWCSVKHARCTIVHLLFQKAKYTYLQGLQHLWVKYHDTIGFWYCCIPLSAQISSARHGISREMERPVQLQEVNYFQILTRQGGGFVVFLGLQVFFFLPSSAIQKATMTCLPQGPVSNPILQGSKEGPIN